MNTSKFKQDFQKTKAGHLKIAPNNITNHQNLFVVMSHDLLFFASKMRSIVEDMGPAVSPLIRYQCCLSLSFGYWWRSFPTASQMYPIEMAPVASQKILPASSGWQALTMLAASMPASSTGFPSNHQYQQFRRSL